MMRSPNRRSTGQVLFGLQLQFSTGRHGHARGARLRHPSGDGAWGVPSSAVALGVRACPIGVCGGSGLRSGLEGGATDASVDSLRGFKSRFEREILPSEAPALAGQSTLDV